MGKLSLLPECNLRYIQGPSGTELPGFTGNTLAGEVIPDFATPADSLTIRGLAAAVPHMCKTESATQESQKPPEPTTEDDLGAALVAIDEELKYIQTYGKPRRLPFATSKPWLGSLSLSWT